MRYPSKTLMKNVTPVPRTLSQANRDAKYACAVQTFKSDTKLTMEFLRDATIGAVIVGTFAGAVFGLVYLFIKG